VIKNYYIGGRKITVKKVPKIKEGDFFFQGEYNPDNNVVRIAHRGGEDGLSLLSKQSKNDTVCHEVIHSWLINMCEEKLSDNEKFVQKMGMALHQFLKTAEWERGVKIAERKLNIK
jgi:hypothetical protein